MKTAYIIKELERAASTLGMKVRYEIGNFRGGKCVVSGEEMIVLNKRHMPETQMAVLARCLSEMPIESVFLKPAVRAIVENAAGGAAVEEGHLDAE